MRFAKLDTSNCDLPNHGRREQTAAAAAASSFVGSLSLRGRERRTNEDPNDPAGVSQSLPRLNAKVGLPFGALGV